MTLVGDFQGKALTTCDWVSVLGGSRDVTGIIGTLLHYFHRQIFGGLQRGFCSQTKIRRRLMIIAGDEQELGRLCMTS